MQDQLAAASNDIRRTPTISRVAGDTIIELVYDPEERTTGLAVSRFGGLWNIEREVRVGTGEILVPYSPSNMLVAHESVLFASRPEHHGDKEALLGEIETFLGRYVDLSPPFLRIAAHYVLLSWVHDAFNELPYLRLQGEYGTGKTRGLLAIGLLCYKPFFASGASTVSPIFHILDVFGGTLVLDEADFRFSDATNELVKILNNGTMSGLPVLRTMQNRHKELNPRAFRVFGPKIAAMRGSYDDDGLESRFLTENMNTRHMRPDIPLHTPSAMRAEARALRNKLLHFRFAALFETKIDPSLASPRLEPRSNQIALPLLSIVDGAEVRAGITEWLARQSEHGPIARWKELVRAVAVALRALFADEATDCVPVRAVAEYVNERRTGARHTTKQIARVIRRQLGLSIHKSDGIHVIARAELSVLAEAMDRIGANTESAATHGF